MNIGGGVGGGANTQSQPGAQPVPGGPGRGAPDHLPPVTSATPDWAALAEENERQHRRKRLMKVGGATLGVVVVGALVATALVVSRPGDHPSTVAATASANPDGPAPGASGSASAAPSESASGSPSASASVSASTSGSPAPGKSGTVKPDTPGGGAPAAPPGLPGLTLAAGATVGPTEGHNGPTLVMRSATGDGYAQSSGPLVDTSKSFTVSAVVRNNAPTGGRAVVTQGSEGYYSFYLGRDYWGTHNQWVFKIQSAPGSDDNNVRQAFSTAPATTGQWLLLTGVYDAGAKTISLYVNGVLQQTGSIPGIWQTNGPTQIGRTKYKGTWTDYWDGSIADVQIWNQALPASAVAQLNSSGGTSAGPAAAHSWLLP